MSFSKIVCPVDFSESSEAALSMAATIARQFDAMLYIVHVEETPANCQLATGNGLSEYKKLLGSCIPPCEDVAERIIRNAECPVLSVKTVPGKGAAAEAA